MGNNRYNWVEKFRGFSQDHRRYLLAKYKKKLSDYPFNIDVIMPNVYQVLRRRQHLTQTQSFGMVIKYFINSASLTRDYVKSSWEVIRCRQHLYCNVTQRLRGNGKTFIGHVIVHSIRTDANIQNIYQVLHLHMQSCKMFPVRGIPDAKMRMTAKHLMIVNISLKSFENSTFHTLFSCKFNVLDRMVSSFFIARIKLLQPKWSYF